ncbi:MAG: MBOAT family protein, partial [Mesorhizobium sp.]|nr:MBOAT family protein [Mesorhizobium sp.]
MLFNSLGFFLFLGVTLGGFAWLPARWRAAWLLVASVIFYGSFGLANLVFLVAVTTCAWGVGLAIARADQPRVRSVLLTAGLVAILGSLAAFKFYDFLAAELERLTAALLPSSSLALPRLGVSAPVGFSFYAFMAAAYVIDVYRGAQSAERNAGRFALFVAWFPKILAGPIERAPNLLPQLANVLRPDPLLLASGLQLIVWGLVKKVVIADNLAPVVDNAFRIAAYASPMEL